MDPTELQMHATIAGAHVGVLQHILQHPDVKAATARAMAAGINIWQIIAVIAPFVIQFITTGKIDWQALIAAILALIPKP